MLRLPGHQNDNCNHENAAPRFYEVGCTQAGLCDELINHEKKSLV